VLFSVFKHHDIGKIWLKIKSCWIFHMDEANFKSLHMTGLSTMLFRHHM